MSLDKLTQVYFRSSRICSHAFHHADIGTGVFTKILDILRAGHSYRPAWPSEHSLAGSRIRSAEITFGKNASYDTIHDAAELFDMHRPHTNRTSAPDRTQWVFRLTIMRPNTMKCSNHEIIASFRNLVKWYIDHRV